MFVIANIFGAAATILHSLIFIYTCIIVIAAIVSWIRLDPYHPVIRALRSLTEPLQWRVRKWMPFVFVSGLDLSPLVIILVLQFVDYALIQSLAELAMRMRMNG